jgi:hypothetical protein
MIEIPPWLYEFRGWANKTYKYKKRKKYEKIIEKLTKIGRNLTNTELT